MKCELNGWQRVWVVFSVITLILAFMFVFSEWPQESRKIIRDIGMSECDSLFLFPEGFVPLDSPNPNKPCYELSRLMYYSGVSINSLDDYFDFVKQKKIYFSLSVFSTWLGSMATLYLLGWSFAWINKGFRKE